MQTLTMFGIRGIPEVRPGDDLASLIVEAAANQGTPLADRDVLVVTQKVVSKAEGRVVDLSTVKPSAFAEQLARAAGKDPRIVELVLREAARIVRMDHGVIITETLHGFVCANAGVDTSNVGADLVTLLPENPDASAASLRARIAELNGADVAVIISDTFGRPWREGIVNFAIGVAGLNPIVDYRGQTDPHGKPLKVTRVAVADELAGAAELVTGKLDRVPAVVIRGYPYRPGPGSIRELIRDPAHDLFR